MARRAERRTWSGGFTIIELLIVIGIIAVLLSILLPLRSRIRERSQLLACQSNLKGMYQAVLAYVNDNDGYTICPSLIGESATGFGRNCCWAMANTGVADLKVGTIWRYMPETQEARRIAVTCPSDSGEAARVGGYINADRNFSYSFNVQVRNSDGSTLKLIQVRQPVKRVMIYEEFGPNDGACYGPGDADDWLTGRHGGENSTNHETRLDYTDAKWREIGQGNVCYFDGHVELMTVQHYFADQSHYSPLKQ